MIDWSSNIWRAGAKLRYHQGHGHEALFCDVFGGLYWYIGLGTGTLFGPLVDGVGQVFHNLSPQEANAKARELGIAMRYVDSFIVSTFTSVMG